ncbi:MULTISPECIES: flavin reductase family protein [Bordetella]|uniref:Flavin reductase n=1 Tax=Bordetella genomosp. 6 TaxID=463024 RepID=A0ABX4FBB8_9BORD|nr:MULTISPECIES: flavin reductase family protein [Bordetella]AOB25745.1 flavin reductase [Bordetella bronchiseptica]AZW43007.1 flavin reductase family protein [Bordetella bronchiseptica]KCV62452.1 flavin reductase-like protein [Bordetella bronchiseptica 99-R-0433]MBN3268442.1 flavin reductase family protein [Bordetella bronchiseptica]OZI73119.1 flavin reductase [Bordetella genomosp. 6]
MDAPRTGLDAAGLSARETYRLLTSCLVPRPIAWVSTCDARGTGNLAPFSFYTMVSTVPPLIALSISLHQGQEKDTLANIRQTGEFVVNVVTRELLAPMHACGERHAPGVDEAQLLGVRMRPSQRVRPAGVALSPVRLECRLSQVLEFGVHAARLVVGEVLHFSIDSEYMRDGRLDGARLDPVCRLGGPWYGVLGERLAAPDPSTPST